MAKKVTYPFTWDHTTNEDLHSLLGGKGANLHKMAVELNLPVPEGFTIATEQCLAHTGKKKLSAALTKNIRSEIGQIEATTARKFGGSHPLLVSVRSGAPVSMPGMMETILNLGLNETTVKELADETNDEQFAYESYVRFIKMFGVIVNGVPAEWYDDRIDAAKRFSASDKPDADTLKTLAKHFLAKAPGSEIPSDVYEQLDAAVLAVFKSWNAEKATAYRDIEGIPHDLGTAVNVQRMVFGNLNDNSGTGVAFTRNPNTGENVYFGDFLVNAQGEDVVDGSHVTLPLSAMQMTFPDIATQLDEIMGNLESHFKDMCDIEFTIENGKLFMLQTRTGKRNPDAAVKMAFDMYDEGLIDKDTAITRVSSIKTYGSAPKKVDDSIEYNLIGKGTAACPGIAIGKAVFTSEDAVSMVESGDDVILIRNETSPDDIKGMAVAQGILTANGGLVSHAAVVARGWGKPCVVGFKAVTVNGINSCDVSGYGAIKKGDIVKIDGTTGEVSHQA